MIFIFWINTPSNSPLSKWLIAKNLPRKLYDLVANPSPTIVMLISNIIFFPILMNKNSFEISILSSSLIFYFLFYLFISSFKAKSFNQVLSNLYQGDKTDFYDIQVYTMKSDCLAGNSHSFKRSLYLNPLM